MRPANVFRCDTSVGLQIRSIFSRAQPNFADLRQHLKHERADVILAAFGFNESFAGPTGLDSFEQSLRSYIEDLRTSAFNGETAPAIVLLSPIASENIQGVAAADMNNANLAAYAEIMQRVAEDLEIGFIDVFQPSRIAMQSPGNDLTINGVHLNESGYVFFAQQVYRGLFGKAAPKVREDMRPSHHRQESPVLSPLPSSEHVLLHRWAQ